MLNVIDFILRAFLIDLPGIDWVSFHYLFCLKIFYIQSNDKNINPVVTRMINQNVPIFNKEYSLSRITYILKFDLVLMNK